MSDLRTEKTFASLVEAFLHLLEKSRFEEITIRQLCDDAKIRRATFYTHFADKYEFLSFFIQEMQKEFIEHISLLNENLEADETDYYEKLFHELILFFEGHPQLVRNLKNSQMLPAMMEIFVEEVRKSVYRYLKLQSKEEEEAELKAYFYAGGILQLLQLWMKEPMKFQVDKINWLQFLV